MPEYRDPDAGRLDLVSAFVLLATVLPVIYGIKKIAEDGFTLPRAAAIVVGAVFAVVFVRRQRSLRDPLIDVQLFGNRGFGASLGVMTVSTFAMMGLNLFVMQYLQLVHGLSPLGAGLWALPMTGGMMVGMMAAPTLTRRIRPAFVIAGGMGTAVFGIALMTQVTSTEGFALLITGTVFMAGGFAPAAALGTDLVISSAPAQKAGAASAASETSNEFGGALGLAILGSVGTAVYRAGMDGEVTAGLAPGATESVRDTLAGAAEVAAAMPAGPGGQLLDAAQTAFTDGLRITAVIAGMMVVAGAVLAAVLLRNVRSGQEPVAEHDHHELALAEAGEATRGAGL